MKTDIIQYFDRELMIKTRIKAKQTRLDLKELSGLSYKTIYNYEEGLTYPTLPKLRILAKTQGLDYRLYLPNPQEEKCFTDF